MNKTNSSINDRSKIENMNNSHHSPSRHTFKKSSGKNLDKTLMYLDNYKSPDMSLLGGNIFSPPSHRYDNDKSTLRRGDDFLTTIESGMDNKISEFVNGDNSIVIKRIQYNRKDPEELMRERESIFVNIELKQKEMIIIKEKDKLENHIKLYKQQRSEFDTKKVNFYSQLTKHQNEVNKLNCERDIFDYQKQLFFNLNIMINSNKIISMPSDKASKGSIFNNITSTAPVSNNSSVNIVNIKSQKGSMEMKKDLFLDPFHSKIY